MLYSLNPLNGKPSCKLHHYSSSLKPCLKIVGKLASNVKQSQSLPLLTFNADIKSLDENKITSTKKSKV